MQDIFSLLKASPIDCENDEMIKIVRHISEKNKNCLSCQISKRNSENIQAKNQTKSDGVTLRVHPFDIELEENQAKKQRLQTDGSSGKHSAIDYETILWGDENWFKVKKVGQVFLQVFDRKFLVPCYTPFVMLYCDIFCATRSSFISCYTYFGEIFCQTHFLRHLFSHLFCETSAYRRRPIFEFRTTRKQTHSPSSFLQAYCRECVAVQCI